MVLHDSVALALFRASRNRGSDPYGCPGAGAAGAAEEWGGEERERGSGPTTRRRSSVRVIELHGRGVPISGTGLSAAFNCITISSRNSKTRRDFSARSTSFVLAYLFLGADFDRGLRGTWVQMSPFEGNRYYQRDSVGLLIF